jgi:adenylate kinase family enzyme
MPRVLVWGCPGSGKSTFARALCKITGLPHVSIDAHFWQPGWVEPDRAEFRERMKPILASEDWVLDGNYTTALHGAQIPRASHVFLFELPRWRCLKGGVGRIRKSYGRVRPEMAPGCPERIDLAFLRYIWNFNEKQYPKLVAALETLRPDQRVERFASRAHANAALDRIAREGLA